MTSNLVFLETKESMEGSPTRVTEDDLDHLESNLLKAIHDEFNNLDIKDKTTKAVIDAGTALKNDILESVCASVLSTVTGRLKRSSARLWNARF